MATTQFTAYTLEMAESIKNVGKLREEISRLRKELNDTNKTEAENAQTLAQLTQMQASLKEVMTGTDKEMQQIIKDNQQATGSYNDLTKQMAQLKAEWKATNDESKRAELGVQINNLNDQLKNLDSTIGNHQRNVGNYEGALNKVLAGFQATAGGARGVINPVKNVTMGFNTLSKTPVIAILGLLANIISSVIAKMKDSQEATERLTKALEPFKVAGQLAQQVVEKVVNVLAGLFEMLGKVAERLNIFGKDTAEAMETQRGLIEEEQALQKLARENTEKNADAELRIQELRNKANGEYKNNIAERKKAIEEIERLEKEKSDRDIELAQREYDLQVARNQQAKTSEADLDKQSELYAKLQAAKASYYQNTRKEESTLANINKQSIEDNEKVVQSTFDRQKVEMDLLQQDIELAEKYSEERYNLQIEYQNRLFEQRQEEARQEIEDEELLNHALENLQRQHVAALEQIDADYQAHRDEIAAQEEAKRQEAEERRKAEEEAQAQEAALKRENDLLELEEGSIEWLEKELQYKQEELDTLQRLEGESAEQFRNRQLKAEQEVLKAKKAITAQKVAIIKSELNATQEVLGGIGSLLDAAGEQSAGAAKALKAVKVAQAGIETINGAVSAYAMAQGVYPPPLGQIYGAIQAGIVTATGMANIAKMKATQISPDGSGSTPTATISAAATPAPSPAAMAPILGDVVGSTSVLTGATGEEYLNQMTSQRVYILSSDLEANGRRVAVQQAETSF